MTACSATAGADRLSDCKITIFFVYRKENDRKSCEDWKPLTKRPSRFSMPFVNIPEK